VDPRFYQIAFLSFFLVLGVLFRDFRLGWGEVGTVIGGGCLAQLLAIRCFRLPLSSLRSALISCLGLLMLIRSQSLWLLGLASFIAILSKFVFRYRGKHFFNPTNFAITIFILTTSDVWISPAQWGEEFVIAAWIVILGVLVTHRALRNDISYSFLLIYLVLLGGRVLYLGQPNSVFLHQLKSGALLLFSFFMISDPKSTPDHRMGRLIFAILVAVLTYFIKFKLYNPNALLIALFFLSPLTPFIDKLFPAKRFDWPDKPRSLDAHQKVFYDRAHVPKFSRLGFLRLLCREG
jgi:enediyne biosynthesis protein E5